MIQTQAADTGPLRNCTYSLLIPLLPSISRHWGFASTNLNACLFTLEREYSICEYHKYLNALHILPDLQCQSSAHIQGCPYTALVTMYSKYTSHIQYFAVAQSQENEGMDHISHLTSR